MGERAERPSRWGAYVHAVVPVPRLAALAAAAEEHGAAVVIVPDEGTDRDVYVTLTAMALATGRIMLATQPCQTTASLTSMLPRVAFEYGHTWCAFSTSASAVARSRFGAWTSSSTARPNPPLGI
jgi:hypothetical protein